MRLDSVVYLADKFKIVYQDTARDGTRLKQCFIKKKRNRRSVQKFKLVTNPQEKTFFLDKCK